MLFRRRFKSGRKNVKRKFKPAPAAIVDGTPARQLSDLRRQLENADDDERAELLEAQRPRLKSKANYVLPQTDEVSGGDAGQEVLGYIDEAMRVAKAGIIVMGWLAHAEGAIRKTSVANSDGRLVEGRNPLTLVLRPDVTAAVRSSSFELTNDEHGFVLYFPVDNLDEREVHWHLVIEFKSGAMRQIPFLLRVSPEPLDGIQRALSRLSGSDLDLGSAFANTLGPCLEDFWAQRRASEVRQIVLSTGDPVPNPLVSVIVPLYRRIDFVKFQAANFSNDPDFIGESAIAEIVYVLDDPPLETDLRALCRLVHLTYGISLRVVILSRNAGYSGANNAGARAARGEFLLLLNSDVLPKRTGWLSNLVDTYRGLSDCGALGCRLLFEDGSLQHAGMAFERREDLIQGAWLNQHLLKGYPASFDRTKGAVNVPAVTGACLLVRTPLYHEVGGLDEGYLVGDYEDSDFCLKLRERGFKTWYTPDVELYHFERQSVKATGAQYKGMPMLTLYNMWKHAKRWGSTIEGLNNDRETTDSTLSGETK